MDPTTITTGTFTLSGPGGAIEGTVAYSGFTATFTPSADLAQLAREAAGRGLRVIIAGAGGAAHLPGMIASMTTLPVIGVPVPLQYLDGLDSLLSIVQMPAGIPVATGEFRLSYGKADASGKYVPTTATGNLAMSTGTASSR